MRNGYVQVAKNRVLAYMQVFVDGDDCDGGPYEPRSGPQGVPTAKLPTILAIVDLYMRPQRVFSDIGRSGYFSVYVPMCAAQGLERSARRA